VKKPRQNDKTAGNQTKHPAPNVLNALLLLVTYDTLLNIN